MPYVRTVKTASGATAVQIVYSHHRGPLESYSGLQLAVAQAAARSWQGDLAARATAGECLNCRAVDICHRELVSRRTTRPGLQRDTLMS